MDNQLTEYYFTSNGLVEDVSSSSSRNFSTKEGGFFAFLVSSDPASYAPLESNSYQLQSLTIKGSGRINLDDVDAVFPELDIYSWVDTLTGDLGSYYFGYLSLTKSISVDSKDYLALVGFDGHSSVDAYTYLNPDNPEDLRVSYVKGAAIKVKGVSATLYSYYDHTGLDPGFDGPNANFMGPITMDGTTGTAILDLVNSLIATEVRYDGASFSDIDLESPLDASYDQYLSSIKGGAVSVKTKGESVYLSLWDSVSGKVSVASGKNGGSYSTVFESSVVKSHDITQSVQGDWTETLFTTIGEKISIKSSSGLLAREITPGPVYLGFLDSQYSSVVDYGFFELTDARKSYTFISDLFRSSTTPVDGSSRGDLGSYYVQTGNSYDVEFTENNLVNKVGSFSVLSESISGAIDSSAKIGSNFFIMNLSTVYKEITGDTYSLEIEPLPGDATYTNIDSFIGDKVSLKGQDVYFHASRESTFGDLKIDAKNNTVVDIVDSDVLKSAVEGDADFEFGKTFGFTYSGETYYEELSKIVGAKIDVKAKGLVDFTLKGGAYIDQMDSPSSNSRVAGDINLSGQQINAIFETADVAKSIIYDGVTAINGDTSNFLGAGLKFKVKGVSGEQSSLIVDDSLFGKVDMSLKKGTAIVDFDESFFSTDLEYNYKWWDRNGDDPDLEVTTEPVDNVYWKYDSNNYYSTEHLNALTGANVKIKGDLSVDFSAERSVMGNVDITAGKSSSADLQFIDSVIVSSISVDDSGYYNFSDGSIKVSALAADVTLTNSYVSLLDLTKVKSGSIVRFNYDVSDTASRIDFLNPQTIEDGTTPEGFNYQTPSLESMQVNLKTNKTADEFYINSPALSLTLTLNGFEWGIDKIYLDSVEINYTSDPAYEGLLNPISKGYYLDFEFFA